MDDKKKSLPILRSDRFYYDHDDKPRGFLFHSVAMYLYSLFNRLVRGRDQVAAWQTQAQIVASSQEPRITWIGHATFFIQIDGLNILTDPIFGNQSFLFKRILPPGIALQDLPPIDVILISHNHYDHMEYKSLQYLRKFQPLILVPQGLKSWFDRYSFDRVVELNWWQDYTTEKGNNISFTFLPAHHWSQRGLFDRNKSLWGSWLIQYEDKSIYFAGDTSYGNHFKEIGNHFSPTVSLLPIGPCKPRKWMQNSHLGAQQACQAFLDLKSKYFIPMHWGTFYFGIDRFLTPIKLLQASWKKNNTLESKQLKVMKVGQDYSL